MMMTACDHGQTCLIWCSQTDIFRNLNLSDVAGTTDCVARVCSRWAKVAAEATTIQLDSCSSPDSLQLWLRRGRAGVHTVKAIEVMKSVGVTTSLPCPTLQQLTLYNSSVDLSPESQLLQDLRAATDLTHLMFFGVTFQGEPDLAGLLSALPGPLDLFLTLIEVQDSTQPAAIPAQGGHAQPQPLWSAADGFKHVSDEGMQFLCTVTQLKALRLDNMQDVSAAGLMSLDNLTGLEELVMWDLSCEVSLSASPGFSQLTALTSLRLKWAEDTHSQFDPSVLARMTQLKDLALLKCTPARGAAGAAELLCCLPHMPQLEGLMLLEVDCWEECPPALLLNVAANSSLRSLVLWVAWDQPGLWQHMLPDSRQLLQLTGLSTNMPCGASDLDLLVSSCSHLQELSMSCTAGLELTPLLQLTTLTSLWLVAVDDSSFVASLAQLSGLQGLERLGIRPLPVTPCMIDTSDLAPLTALTQLKQLALPCEDGALTPAMHQQLQRLPQDPLLRGPFFTVVPSTEWACLAITNTAPDGAPSDVWSQLLSCCEDCTRAAQHDSQVAVGASPVVWLRRILRHWQHWRDLYEAAMVFAACTVLVYAALQIWPWVGSLSQH